MTPGIYHDVSMVDYLAIKAVSAGVLCSIIERCPAAAWYESPWNRNRPRDDNDASDAGTIAHEIFLEGSRDCLQVIDPKDHPAEKGGAIPKGWTNKSIRTARNAARALGKIPVLPDDVAEIDSLVAAAQSFVESLRKTEPAIWQMFQPDGGTSETTIVWLEGRTLCKLRADRIATNHEIVVDYKSTKMSVEPSSWARNNLDYQGAAWYRRGVRAITGIEPDYIFLCGERDPPYLHSLVGVDPAGLALGDEKIGSGLRMWQECERKNEWPGYPPRVHYVEVPPWEQTRWAERQGVGEDGLPSTNAELWLSQFERTK